MAGQFIERVRYYFKVSLLARLIVINCAIFLVVRLSLVFFSLFMVEWHGYLAYLQMPSSFAILQRQPWSVLTYMFLHIDFFHLFFNMLWLYWFGRIFLHFFSERQLVGVYLGGGVTGALFFFLAYNLFPFYREVLDFGLMMGASAAVMAVVFAVSFYDKEYKIELLFLGRIKLIHLALFILFIDLISVASGNAGGHISHIGGALFGILFAYQQRKGDPLTALINLFRSRLVHLKRKKHEKKSRHVHHVESDMEYRARKKEEMDSLDLILDKLKKSGYKSLSSEEKKRLFEASKK